MNFEFLKMWMKERKGIPIRPVLLKFGVAFVISIGGIVFTLIRAKIIRPSISKPSHPSTGNGSQAYSRVESGEFRGDDCVFQDSPLKNVASNNSISSRSSTDDEHNPTDQESFLLQEFNDLIKEFDLPVTTHETSPISCSDHEHEIIHLQGLVKTLEEREKKLESQLLGHHGLKDHENALIELKNQLRLNNMEAKLYNLKIESLVSNNKRLEAQLTDYVNVVNELEVDRAKVKALTKKLKSESEQHQEQILVLRDRVMRLADEEKKVAEMKWEVEAVLREREELRREIEEMKTMNQSLRLENADLAQKLDYVKMLATTALDNEEVLELREERRRLRKQNESMKKEMERLQANHRSDGEELAHIRWVNECLRQQLPGTGLDDKPRLSYSPAGGPNTSDLESTSCLTDSGDRDKPTPDNNGAEGSGKPKVFAKLKRLLRRGGKEGQGQSGKKSTLERAVSVDDIAGKLASDFLQLAAEGESSASTSRRSFDMPRSGSRGRKGGFGPWESSNSSSRTMSSLTEEEEEGEYWSPGGPRTQDEVKNELLKYAEALNRTHSKRFPKPAAGFGLC